MLAAALLCAPLWTGIISAVVESVPFWFQTRVLSVSWSLRGTPAQLVLAALLALLFPWMGGGVRRTGSGRSTEGAWSGLTLLTMAVVLSGNLVLMASLWWLHGVLSGPLLRATGGELGRRETLGAWGALPAVAGLLALVAVLIPALYNHDSMRSYGLEPGSTVALGLWMTSGEFASMNPRTLDIVGVLLAGALVLRAGDLWFLGRRMARAGVESDIRCWGCVMAFAASSGFLWQSRVLWSGTSLPVRVAFCVVFVVWVLTHLQGAVSKGPRAPAAVEP